MVSTRAQAPLSTTVVDPPSVDWSTPAGRAAAYQWVRRRVATDPTTAWWIDWTGEITAARRPGGPWQPRDRYGRWVRIPVGFRRRADLAVRYDTGIARVRQRIDQGLSGHVDVVELGDGSLAVRKQVRITRPDDRDFLPTAGLDAEELAGAVAEAFGLNAPGVLRAARDTVVMDYMDGTAYPLTHVDARGEPVRELLDSDQGRLIGLFDLVAANFDRHGANWMLDGERLVAIDHGLAWYPAQLRRPADQPPWGGGPFSRHFVASDPGTGRRVWASNDMSPRDMALVRSRMRTLRSEFERLDRLHWWEWSMGRLDAVAAHATGTRTRVR